MKIEFNSYSKKKAVRSQQLRGMEHEVDRLKRNESRDGENFEYLKNIVISFMESANQRKVFFFFEREREREKTHSPLKREKKMVHTGI